MPIFEMRARPDSLIGWKNRALRAEQDADQLATELRWLIENGQVRSLNGWPVLEAHAESVKARES